MHPSNCPFCGFKFPKDLIDNVYPTGTFWIEEDDGFRHYVHRNDVDYSKPHGPCYKVVCQTHMGGCGATIDDDSYEAAIERWNRRTQCQK